MGTIEIDILKRFKPENLNYEQFKNRNNCPDAGTCEWWQDHPNCQAWRNKSSGLVLLTADPGVGKSALARYLVDSLLPNTEPESTVCHFFFKDDNEVQKSSRMALCALIHQLLQHDQELFGRLTSYITGCGDSLYTDFAALWRLLIFASQKSTRQIICILDALDECKDISDQGTEQKGFLENLKYYVNSPPPNSKLKLFITSRPRATVMDRISEFKAPQSICIKETDRQDRIRKGIAELIDIRVESFSVSRGLTETERAQLSGYFNQDKMTTSYLWVELLYQELMRRRDLHNKDWLKLAAGFPTSLDSI